MLDKENYLFNRLIDILYSQILRLTFHVIKDTASIVFYIKVFEVQSDRRAVWRSDRPNTEQIMIICLWVIRRSEPTGRILVGYFKITPAASSYRSPSELETGIRCCVGGMIRV